VRREPALQTRHGPHPSRIRDAHHFFGRDGVAGLAVTATAVVAAVTAPAMAIITRGIDRRAGMCVFTVVMIASNTSSE